MRLLHAGNGSLSLGNVLCASAAPGDADRALLRRELLQIADQRCTGAYDVEAAGDSLVTPGGYVQPPASGGTPRAAPARGAAGGAPDPQVATPWPRDAHPRFFQRRGAWTTRLPSAFDELRLFQAESLASTIHGWCDAPPEATAQASVDALAGRLRAEWARCAPQREAAGGASAGQGGRLVEGAVYAVQRALDQTAGFQPGGTVVLFIGQTAREDAHGPRDMASGRGPRGGCQEVFERQRQLLQRFGPVMIIFINLIFIAVQVPPRPQLPCSNMCRRAAGCSQEQAIVVPAGVATC